MVENVQRNPELYPYFRKENNIFYKHIFNKYNIGSNQSDWKIVIPYKHIFNKYNIGSNQSDWKIVIPASHRKQILDTYHDHETAAHLGISKILSRILELYYWPNLRKDVQNTPNAESHHQEHCQISRESCLFGMPQIFICDNGTQFQSAEFKNFLNGYQVQKIWLNAGYHLQINSTERQNRVIVAAIRSYIKENHKTWDQPIHKIAQPIRLAKHDVTRTAGIVTPPLVVYPNKRLPRAIIDKVPKVYGVWELLIMVG
ncbi:Integrase zinc binding domain [Popillia japonica]|uniref:RNA-directed DNA polymerase n=1 Tax=Popillia japonica TaxID=7064 RepID=A0AAW1KZG7_POPJA